MRRVLGVLPAPPVSPPSIPSSSKHPLLTGTPGTTLAWAFRGTRPPTKGPPPPSCCPGSGGPRTDSAFRRPRSPRTVRMVRAANSQGASGLGSWAADLASHAVECLCAGAKVPEGTFWKAEEQTAECKTTAARKHISGPSLLRDFLGSKERTPAVLSSDRCCSGTEAEGRLGEGHPVHRGLAGSAQAAREPFRLSPLL